MRTSKNYRTMNYIVCMLVIAVHALCAAAVVLCAHEPVDCLLGLIVAAFALPDAMLWDDMLTD